MVLFLNQLIQIMSYRNLQNHKKNKPNENLKQKIEISLKTKIFLKWADEQT